MIDVRKLDARGFDAVRDELAALLVDVVGHGASVGFLAPLAPSEAGLYWESVRAAMVGGARVLFAAWQGGRLAGSVQLDLCQRANGVNRAEVQKLVVHSRARRAGVATALMQALEREALALRRGLLFLDTEAGSGAEGFYRGMDYTRVGELPQFACDTAGQWKATALYYKTLFARAPGDTGAGQAITPAGASRPCPRAAPA